MGIFDFFKGRRGDEDALQTMRESEGTSLAGANEVFEAGGLAAEVNVADDIPNLGVALDAIKGNPWLKMFGLDEKIIEAIESGKVQIGQMPTQTIDLRGTGARDQILGVLNQHGIDTANPGQAVNVSGNAEMQEQIFEVLKKHGVDPTPQDPND